jgi:arginyl-tRNA synthetase
MEIDLDLFKSKSSENPVFYIQYAHARLCSILKKANEKHFDFETKKILSLKTTEEINLAKKISEFPELLHRVSKNYGVHELTFFALELSQLIQKFYENNRVFDNDSDDKEITKSRLIITKASKITLANLLSLMGMSSPEEM